jgi:hypothetical protein
MPTLMALKASYLLQMSCSQNELLTGLMRVSIIPLLQNDKKIKALKREF